MSENEVKTGCICPLSGFCSRHNITKTPHLHKLCQNHSGYFDAWENCKGPGQQNTDCSGESARTVALTDRPNLVANISKEEVQPILPKDAQFPSMFQQAKNFAKASVEHIKNGANHVSVEKQQERMSICHACPLYDAQSNRCKACGCNLAVKTKWETSKCPHQKW